MNNIVDFKKPEPPKQEKPKHPPLINLPPVTKYLLILLIGIYALTAWFISPQQRVHAILQFGFIPNYWTGLNAYDFGYFSSTLLTPLTYMFLHASWMHLFMNGTMLMAFGAGVEKWMGGKKFILFYLICGIASAIVETAIHPASGNPVIGASGAISGLFAAILVILQRQGRLPTGKYGILPFAALWIGISVIFGLVGGSLAGGPIAWAAHLGGFIAGFGLLKTRFFRL